jgi:hypothetical protein
LFSGGKTTTLHPVTPTHPDEDRRYGELPLPDGVTSIDFPTNHMSYAMAHGLVADDGVVRYQPAPCGAKQAYAPSMPFLMFPIVQFDTLLLLKRGAALQTFGSDPANTYDDLTVGLLAINQGQETGDWQFSRVYVWNRHLSNAEFADASAKLNSYVAGVQTLSCVPSIGCSCNTGYTGPETGASKGQCTICPSGTYKNSSGSATCTNCTANANSLLGSTNVSDCSCKPGYTGPDVGPCVACAAGTFKNVSGSAACSVCPANTYAESGASTRTSFWLVMRNTFSIEGVFLAKSQYP